MSEFGNQGEMFENFEFHEDFQEALRDAAKDIPRLRVLDYGAGIVPHPIGQFDRITMDQQPVVAYDPSIAPSSSETITQWTNQEPEEGKEFDLVIAHFSLHHMEHPPSEIIQNMQKYNPKVIAIADYDYTDPATTTEQFVQTFRSEPEKKELRDVFHGDSEACFDAHRTLGTSDFENALTQAGYSVGKTKRGEGNTTRNKVFLIGTRDVNLQSQ